MSNESKELIKAGIKFLAGIAAVVAGGTLINKGNENVKQHRDQIQSGKK